MAANFDPGLTTRYTRPLKRSINKRGDFNVVRRGARLRDMHPYLFLVSVSPWTFSAILVGSFVVMNALFAALYSIAGIEHLKNAHSFLDAFFFSAHTLTTVGYGSIYPEGVAANSIASIEALAGLMMFAIATGLLFGRFSRPSARIGFSDKAIVAPYNDGRSIQFRIVNRRDNNLLDVSARVLLVTVESLNGRLQRKFSQLQLERETINFFAITWTVVHPVTEDSPLAGKTAQELADVQAELLVSVKAFDETFGQTVNVRRSYRHDEIVWGAKYSPAFDVNDEGRLVLEVDAVSNYEPAEVSARL